jgi:hypothetical protein
MVTVAGRVARNHVVLGGTVLVVVQQRFPVDARTDVVAQRTDKVDFQSTGSEPLALQARVVQFSSVTPSILSSTLEMRSP